MFSRVSRQEIIRRLEVGVGHPINEDELSQGTRQAITELAAVQRHLFIISEVLKGEQGRLEQSTILRLSSKVHRDRELEAHTDEITKLQAEINGKVSEVSAHILQEDKARQSGGPLPERQRGGEPVGLKCPTCGAALPMPTGRFMKCQYCNSSLSIQDISQQMTTMIRNI